MHHQLRLKLPAFEPRAAAEGPRALRTCHGLAEAWCAAACSSRKGVVDTALNLVKVARLNQFIGSPAQQQQLNNTSASILSKQLQQTLPAGVGFHHAAMEPQDRATVEDLFRNRMLAVSSSCLLCNLCQPA